jgi:hypothetical protein
MYNANSTPDELLHAYIDGELDTEFEQQFYSMLATDSEMRRRLRQFRTVRGEARRFGAVATPPPEVTSAVFTRLGFSTTPSASHSRLAGAALLLRSAWAPGVSAAAAVVITSLLILALQETPRTAAPPTLASEQPGPALHIAKPATSPSSADDPATTGAQHRPRIDDGTRSAGEGRTNVAAGDDRDAYRSGRTLAGIPSRLPSTAMATEEVEVKNPTPADGTGGSIVTDEQPVSYYAETRQIQPSDDVALPPSAAYVELPGSWADADPHGIASGGSDAAAMMAKQSMVGQGTPMPGVHAHDAIDTRRYFPALDGGPGLQFLSIEIRGVSAASFPAATIGTRSNPLMENMAAALYYSNEQHDVGLEYGQEPFSQHYNGMEFGKPVRYEQNLLTSWLLAGYRYRFAPVPMLGSVEPYVTAGIGSTLQAWPIARAGAGLMYMPDRRVRFHIGLEGALLAFPYQENWFTSKRAGLTYCISVLL